MQWKAVPVKMVSLIISHTADSSTCICSTSWDHGRQIEVIFHPFLIILSLQVTGFVDVDDEEEEVPSWQDGHMAQTSASYQSLDITVELMEEKCVA